jgi:hypothetical protein
MLGALGWRTRWGWVTLVFMATHVDCGPLHPVATHSVREPPRPAPPVLVQSFSHPLQAQLALGHLHSLGIPAALQDLNLLSVAGHLTHAVGGIKLWVPGVVAAEARTALLGAQAVAWPEEPQDAAAPSQARLVPPPLAHALPLGGWAALLQVVMVWAGARIPLDAALMLAGMFMLVGWNLGRGVQRRHA